mmetsp:Transcript_16575/g.25614  ORF Transcript_16575/g.25614 Transcript_16575/m.25614 type:complete len:293 (+) Transcript_16575:115-993(+)
MALQSNVRSVKVRNNGADVVLVRVSFQTSAVTKQHVVSFQKLARSTCLDNSGGGGFGIGLSGFGKFSANLQAAKSNKNSSSDECFNSHEIEMILSPFIEEGWVGIKPTKSKRFAVQADRICYVSVLDSYGNLKLQNWNTVGTDFVWDGDDLDENDDQDENMSQKSPPYNNCYLDERNFTKAQLDGAIRDDFGNLIFVPNAEENDKGISEEQKKSGSKESTTAKLKIPSCPTCGDPMSKITGNGSLQIYLGVTMTCKICKQKINKYGPNPWWKHDVFDNVKCHEQVCWRCSQK